MMNTPWTAEQLTAFLLAQGVLESVLELRDAYYCLPRWEWLPGWRRAFAAELAGKQRGTYQSDRNDCENFAALADEAAQTQWNLTPNAPEAGLAVGVCECYVGLQKHALNAGVFVREGQPTLLFLEPQAELAQAPVTLSNITKLTL